MRAFGQVRVERARVVGRQLGVGPRVQLVQSIVTPHIDFLVTYLRNSLSRSRSIARALVSRALTVAAETPRIAANSWYVTSS